MSATAIEKKDEVGPIEGLTRLRLAGPLTTQRRRSSGHGSGMRCSASRLA